MRSSRFVVKLMVGAAFWIVAVGLVSYGYGQLAGLVVERAIDNTGDGAKPVVGSPVFRTPDWSVTPNELAAGFESFDYSDAPALGGAR